MSFVMGGMPRMQWGANKKLVFDGNSLVFGAGVSSDMSVTKQMEPLAPLSDQYDIVNLGVSGQTVRQMNGLDGSSAADVDAAFDATKTNILLGLEWVNSALGALRTPAQTVQDYADYCEARLALNPWHIWIVTSTAAQLGNNQGVVDANNALLLEVDDLLLQNWRAMGAKGITHVRKAGSPFYMASFGTDDFAATAISDLYIDVASEPQRVHYSVLGNATLAGIICADLVRMPRR